ncbi:30S ribosomal protein S2, partial [Alistipes sp. OttesenSCG-928-B03]|nr:30S ribosomal protein S2 [Alistipes sp. OttesenSCG-928-B03]
SIAVIIDAVTAAIAEGLNERKLEKDKEALENVENKDEKDGRPRTRKAVKAHSEAKEEEKPADNGPVAEADAVSTENETAE